MNGMFMAGLERLVSERRETPAVFALSERRTLSFADIAAEYRTMVTAFDRARVTTGGCVLVLTGNHASWFALFLTCLERGDVLMSLDPGTTRSEVERLRSRYCASAMVTRSSANYASGTTTMVLPGGLELHPFDGHESASFGDARLLKLTSGSSGEPKAVLTSEENLWNDGRHIVAAMGIEPRDVNYGVIPLSHSYGLGNLVAPLFLQGTAVALRDLFLPSQLFEDARSSGLSVLPGVPYLLQQIHQQHRQDGLPPSLRLVISAGAQIASSVVQSFKEDLGMKIHSFYGSSETGGITYDDEDELTEPINVGKPVPETAVSLRPDPRAPGEDKRICVGGNAVARGYFETSSDERLCAFADGEFASGDLGAFDERGRLFLTGRLTSFVNVAGRKVNPSEVEDVLLEMPEIADAMVLGLPCDRRGQRLVAFIVPRGDDPSSVRVRSYCAEKLSPHKIPRDLIVLGSMPRTTGGKVDRRALEALSGSSDTETSRDEP